MSSSRVVITCAGGYIGRHLSMMYIQHGYSVTGCVKTSCQFSQWHSESVLVEDITSFSDWSGVLNKE